MVKVKQFRIPGSETLFEVCDWYGACSTPAATQTKTVSIDGFSANSLYDGARVTIKFTKAQTYSGIPKLNVSSTGAKEIYRRVGETAGQHEWEDGAILTFVYYSGTWVIDDGGHATIYRWGKTRLASTFNYDNLSDASKAATGELVGDSLRHVGTFLEWDGRDYSSTVLVNTTTPVLSEWENYTADSKTCFIEYDDISSLFNSMSWSVIRCMRVTFHEHVQFCYPQLYNDVIYFSFGEVQNGFMIIVYPEYSQIIVSPSEAGAYAFKIEIFGNGGANQVTYPTMKHYLDTKGYLTLADLPIYDGSVT